MDTIEVQVSELTLIANMIDTCTYILLNWEQDVGIKDVLIEARKNLRMALKFLNEKEVK